MISRFLTFFLTIFLFFNFGSFFSQNTNLPLNKLNKKGEKIGKWKVLHENSNQLRYSGQFENNIPTGNFIYYYPSGNLSAKMKYINDSVSYVSHYHDNGHFMGAGKFINKLKDSLWTIYNRQGQLIGKSFYNHGILNGTQEVFYAVDFQEDLKIAERYYVENGLKSGKWVQFFMNGTPKASGGYKEGSKTGEFIYYLENGTIEEKGRYVNNLKEGKWLYYNGENNIYSEVNYIKGEPIKDNENPNYEE